MERGDAYCTDQAGRGIQLRIRSDRRFGTGEPLLGRVMAHFDDPEEAGDQHDLSKASGH